MKTKYWILAILIALAAGFFLGRATTGTKEKVEYVKGETVHGRVAPDFLTAKYEFKTGINFLPYIFWKGDTVKINEIEYVHTIPDTARIIEDFLIKREYEFTVFDDDNGKLDINQTIQYNKLQSFDYSFTPIHKNTTITKKNLFEPFGSVGYTTFNQVSFGGGFFLNNLGLEYNYIMGDVPGHGLSVKLKF